MITTLYLRMYARLIAICSKHIQWGAYQKDCDIDIVLYGHFQHSRASKSKLNSPIFKLSKISYLSEWPASLKMIWLKINEAFRKNLINIKQDMPRTRSKTDFQLKPALGGVCSLVNYNVAYEETQSNRVSDFHDFVCSLFPKAILFYFYFITQRQVTLRWIGRSGQFMSLSKFSCLPWLSASFVKSDK